MHQMVSKRTLLIVEDEPELRDILVELLQPVATEIKAASDGLEALEILNSGGVDAVLSDIKMPRMTGLQLLAEVRHRSNDLPFVILTGFGDVQTLREVLRLNATDLLDKPFDSKAVVDIMDKALQLGVALRTIEADLLSKQSDIAGQPEQIVHQRELKRCLAMLRASRSIYFKKAAGT